MSRAVVLCYHAVSPDWHANLSVTPESLEHQLGWLAARGWRGVTFSDALAEAPGRRVAVTFDDAFLSVFRCACPMLDRLGWPATIFAPTGFMDSRQTLSWAGIEQWQSTEFADELISMDWADLTALADQGWEIGSHTVSHPKLTQLGDDALRAELEHSRAACELHLNKPCRSIAYPYGDLDERVASAAREAGYSCGAALSSSLRRLGPWRSPRVAISHADDARRFRLKLNPLTRAARASRLWPAG